MEYDFENQVNRLMADKEWPEDLQAEMKDEWVFDLPSDESVSFVQYLNLKSPKPVKVKISVLLMDDRNIEAVQRAPQKVIDVVNEQRDMDIQIGQQFEHRNPNRYFEYAKLPPETAKPCVMINGVIEMGCGRFVAAIMRGDEYIYVWDLSEVR